jgi:hypothetical protein
MTIATASLLSHGRPGPDRWIIAQTGYLTLFVLLALRRRFFFGSAERRPPPHSSDSGRCGSGHRRSLLLIAYFSWEARPWTARLRRSWWSKEVFLSFVIGIGSLILPLMSEPRLPRIRFIDTQRRRRSLSRGRPDRAGASWPAGAERLGPRCAALSSQSVSCRCGRLAPARATGAPPAAGVARDLAVPLGLLLSRCSGLSGAGSARAHRRVRAHGLAVATHVIPGIST